jgi:hypothetical protein
MLRSAFSDAGCCKPLALRRDRVTVSTCSYPSAEGQASPPVAVCISKASEYQKSHYFYDRPRGADDGASTCGGLPKSLLIASFESPLVGFAHNNTGAHPCIVPGIDCPDFQRYPGKLGVCKRCSKTSGEHAVGVKLVLTKQGRRRCRPCRRRCSCSCRRDYSW